MCIEAHHLASGTIARVDTHDTLLSQRWSKQELAQVAGKYTDGFFIGLLLAQGSKFGFDARLQESLVSIQYCFFHLLAALIIATHVVSHEAFGALLIVGRDGYLQQTFGFTSADGQQAVRSASLQRFAEVEVIFIFGSFFFLTLH